MKNFPTIFFLFLLVVSGCNSQKVDENVASESISVSVFFCPKDNCEEVFITEINTAKSRIECAFFDLDVKELIQAFGKKSSEIDVKIIIDENNYENQLVGAGVKVANAKQYMHNKFCIIDETKIITGSANPTDNGFNFNNNNLLIFESENIVKNFKHEFDELWNEIYSTGEKTEITKTKSRDIIIETFFCPEDNCKEKVIEALHRAEESIYFMTFSFTDEEIADTILLKNVDVKGVFEKRSANGLGSQYQRLKDFGINIKTDENKKTMHHKVFIIDNKTVITGSYNPTRSGNERNDENLLIIQNEQIARMYVEEFNRVFPK